MICTSDCQDFLPNILVGYCNKKTDQSIIMDNSSKTKGWKMYHALIDYTFNFISNTWGKKRNHRRILGKSAHLFLASWENISIGSNLGKNEWYPKILIKLSDVMMEMISLNNYGKLKNGRNLKMGKSYLYFQKKR